MLRILLLAFALSAFALPTWPRLVALPESQSVRMLTALLPTGAQVLDDQGHPVAGVVVDFEVFGPPNVSGVPPSLFGAPSSPFVRHVTTDESGLAKLPEPAYPTMPGTFRIHATSAYGSTDLNVEAVYGEPPQRIVPIAGTGQSAPAGGNLPQPFSVQVFDADGATVPRAVVTFTVRATDVTAGGSFNGSSVNLNVVANEYGIATSTIPLTTALFPGRGVMEPQVWPGYTANLVRGEVAFEVTAPAPGTPASYQDMWWGGPAENGWGVSITQHDGRFFMVVFAYDDDGQPTWYVMPQSRWEFAPGTSLLGDLYRPTGAPFTAFDPRSVVVGESVGYARMGFTGANRGGISFFLPISGSPSNPSTYFIYTGAKTLTRQDFRPNPALSPRGLGDMWWGGTAQSGWGVSIMEQMGGLFSVWFTYGADRKATWFVMPVGTWNSAGEYEGVIYRTSGPKWRTSHYDASSLKVSEAGTFRFEPVGASLLRMHYTVDGVGGTLNLSRQPF